MQKFKKFMAAAVAATMVMGLSLTAYAEDTAPAAPVTTGTVEGAGTSEGHVDKKVISVVLPVVGDNNTTFNYTMDLERLIKETETAHTDISLPSTGDTGVYFLTGETSDSPAKNKYENTSKELTVTSKSSHAVKVTVDVKAVSAVTANETTDVPLVATAAEAAGTVKTPALYLGLVVDTQDAVAVKKGENVSKTVELAGVDTNFEVKYDSAASGNKYSYALKTDADETKWSKTSFKITGAASNASAKGLTAPKLQVTWRWVDPAAAASLSNAVPSSDTGVDFDATYTIGRANTFTFTGIGDDATVTLVAWGANAANAATATAQANGVTKSGTSFTLPSGVLTSVGSKYYYKVATSNSKTYIVKVTAAAAS